MNNIVDYKEEYRGWTINVHAVSQNGKTMSYQGNVYDLAGRLRFEIETTYKDILINEAKREIDESIRTN